MMEFIGSGMHVKWPLNNLQVRTQPVPVLTHLTCSLITGVTRGLIDMGGLGQGANVRNSNAMSNGSVC